MSPAGVFLRSIVALLLGVTAFLALGYSFVAMGVRDTLRSPQPLLTALEKHDAYNRVYDEGIISEQFEGALRGLVGDFSIEPETEAWLLKEILPPSELKDATEQSVISVIAFLNDETDTFDATIDLAPAIPRIKPAVFRLVDERIDKAQRITVTGEVIDSWCYLSEIMWATGSAHHRCAVWCARGGVPVGILSEDDEEVYVVLMMENNPDVIGNKAIFRMQTNEVVVTGDLYERDSVKYLAVNEIVEDHGIVNYSHEDFDIQPGGL